MKKKIYALFMMVMLVLLAAGCGKKEQEKKSDVKSDILNFVNKELPAIEDKKNTAINIYNSYFENENVDIRIFLNDMETTAIPSMKTYMDELDAIETATDEVKDLKDLYSLSCQLQYDAMNKVVLAIKEENSDYLTDASVMITQSETYLAQYEQELKALAAENDITIYGNLNLGTSTDAQ